MEALNADAIINQMALNKPVALEDQYNGRISYFIPVLVNGRIFIGSWNTASLPKESFVKILRPDKMRRNDMMLVNQLPFYKFRLIDENSATLIINAVLKKLRKYENEYVKEGAFVFPLIF